MIKYQKHKFLPFYDKHGNKETKEIVKKGSEFYLIREKDELKIRQLTLDTTKPLDYIFLGFTNFLSLLFFLGFAFYNIKNAMSVSIVAWLISAALLVATLALFAKYKKEEPMIHIFSIAHMVIPSLYIFFIAGFNSVYSSIGYFACISLCLLTTIPNFMYLTSLIGSGKCFVAPTGERIFNFTQERKDD